MGFDFARGGGPDEVQVDIFVHHDEDYEGIRDLTRQMASPLMCDG
jgi:hypothetical protein